MMGGRVVILHIPLKRIDVGLLDSHSTKLLSKLAMGCVKEATPTPYP